ncbi:hypothetical protein F5B20DRAFT_555629, partial [Whalleya microplaca]
MSLESGSTFPVSSNILTISVQPKAAASNNGVRPRMSLELGSTSLVASNTLTISIQPKPAASDNGVQP